MYQREEGGIDGGSPLHKGHLSCALTRQLKEGHNRQETLLVRGRQEALRKAKDKELLFKGKWHKLIRWIPSSTHFLPSSQVQGLGFLIIAFGNGIQNTDI